MNKTNILLTIFIISIISGVYFLIKTVNASSEFKSDFNEFEPQSELRLT